MGEQREEMRLDDKKGHRCYRCPLCIVETLADYLRELVEPDPLELLEELLLEPLDEEEDEE